MERLQQANYYARMSCTRWNKPGISKKNPFYPLSNKLHGASRRHYREKYREMAMADFYSEEHQALVTRYKAGILLEADTYLPLFKNPEFADWDESDKSDDYTLISDPSGCVIRYATSYCAYKIFEETGKWPQKTTSRRLDARNWEQFLAEAGYTNMWVKPKNGHRFVGIDAEDGEYGTVVWFEAEEKCADDIVYVSSYLDKSHHFWGAKWAKYTWIQIS